MTIDPATLPPADAEQQHVLDEVEHYEDYELFQHGDFPKRCSDCGQPVPQDGAR